MPFRASRRDSGSKPLSSFSMLVLLLLLASSCRASTPIPVADLQQELHAGKLDTSERVVAASESADDSFRAVETEAGVDSAFQPDSNFYVGSSRGTTASFGLPVGILSMQQKLLAENPATSEDGDRNDNFGWSVAISDDVVVAGAPLDDDSGLNAGSAYVYARTGPVWTLQQKLTATDPGEDHQFGYSVAASGDTVVVGSPRDSHAGENSGSVYVYVRDGGVWSLQQKVVSPTPRELDHFGHSVGVSEDTLVVGAYSHNEVFVYERIGDTWYLQTELIPAEPKSGDNYGWSVAIDGDTVIVGAPNDDTLGLRAGAAYVFERGPTGWVEQVKLISPDGLALDKIGESVAVNGDTAVIGAGKKDDLGEDAGQAYVYARVGITWFLQQTLTAPAPEAYDRFGTAVATNGETVVVGSPEHDSPLDGPGTVYVFTRSDSTWTMQQELVAENPAGTPDGYADEAFGFSVGISVDSVVAGSYRDNDVNLNTGSAYVYAPDTGTDWPPRVNKIDSQGDTGGGSLYEGEPARGTIIKLMVSFSEDVQGGTGPDGAESPDNYSLVADPDGAATPMVIDAISYDPATHVATLDLNGGVPLPDNHYRLTVVGTTSIRDLAGQPLDGNSDGIGGDDFTRNFVVDSIPPSDPDPATVVSPSHATPSSSPWIVMNWGDGDDGPNGSGVAGYSVTFNVQPIHEPDPSVDVPHGVTSPNTTSSSPLADGSWYFHLKTCDNAGNCSTGLHSGPYVVDSSVPVTITVNSTADVEADDGFCTLREAITASNTNTASGASGGECAAGQLAPGLDAIRFSVAGTILLTDQLPPLSEGSLIIDGFSAPGWTPDAPVILLDGDNTPLGAAGFEIVSADNVVRGLAITGFYEPLHEWVSDDAGIKLAGTQATDNWIYGNHLGRNYYGATTPANRYGVVVMDHASGNVIGTDGDGVDDDLERNLISRNFQGAAILDTGTTDNVVAGNYIGINTAGDTALPNEYDGVLIDGGAQSNLIGTDGDGWADAAERNVISGNERHAVLVYGSNTANNVVAGNYIGTNAAGDAAIPNEHEGVLIDEGAHSNVIGAGGNGVAHAAERNVISGNLYGGILIDDTSTDNVVAGNYIGTNAAGDAPLPNGSDGVQLSEVEANLIGTDGDGVADAAERNVISGNTRHGVHLGLSSNNTIAGNYIGTDPTGFSAVPNGQEGIHVAGNTAGNLIGTDGDGVADAAERNLISGNTFSGVVIDSSSSHDNVVAGNYIGSNQSGNAPLPNGSRGVFIQYGYSNLVGTNGDGVNDDAERNLISGNTSYGVVIDNGDGNVVAGNYVGTVATGTGALPNGGGVAVTDGAQSNRIGTDGNGTADAAERNVISGNTWTGVYVNDDNTANNTVAGNYVGISATGNSSLPNGSHGVQITGGAQSNLIGTDGDGTADEAERNVISGNGGSGVFIDYGGSGTSNNTIAGNTIGLDADRSDAVPNLVGVTADSGGNVIGGTTPAEANVIAGNTGAGIEIVGVLGVGNAIRQNSIFDNGDLGIDLDSNGATPNDPDDPDTGPNNLQNYPIVTLAMATASTATIAGTLDSTPDTTFRVEFFANASCDPSGYGEGETYVGFEDVTTNGSGDATFSATLGTAVPVDHWVTATATDPANNTSEFSACQQVVDAFPPTVTNVNSIQDTGDGSLEEGEATDVLITNLLIAFSEEVQDGGGPDGAENQSNYSLVIDPDGAATPVPIDAISYDPGTGVATVDLNGGVPLSPGDYRLTIAGAGSPSIKDLTGTPLDGNGDGTGGDDFVRNFSVAVGCYTLTTAVNPTGGGNVTVSLPPDCNSGTKYSHGTVVDLTAIPALDYIFTNWSGDASGTDNPVSVTMDADKTVTANFHSDFTSLPVDLFADSTLESGVVSSVQSIFGPDICTAYGDPYTPTLRTVGTPNPWYAELNGTYPYRIRIPRSYVESFDTLRIEILDPDGYNAPNGDVTVTHEDSTTEVITISGERKDAYLIDIDDGHSPNNDFWFHRIDEIRGTDTPGMCGEPSSYDPESGVNSQYETSIGFNLFYYQEQGDGSLVRRNLASYTSPRSGIDAPPAGHPTFDQHCTDLRWASPGAQQGLDYDYGTCPQGVPADGTAGSPYAYTPDAGNGDFQIQLPTIDYGARTCSGGEMPSCAIDPLTDDIFVYLDVTGLAGGSENDFHFWAGPDLSVYDIPTEVNQRNLHVLTHGLEASHSSQGVDIMGIGHLPLNTNANTTVEIPLTYVGPELAGQTVRINLFDMDAGSDGPITFTLDTVPEADWSYTTCDDIGTCPGQVISGGNLNDEWADPPFEFVVPTEVGAPPVAFTGGILTARFQAGFLDTHSWSVTVRSTTDTTPPQVTHVNTVADTGDGTLEEDEATTADITQLLVTFSEEVEDGTGPDGAENPANYSLVADPDGSPTLIAIDAVSYDPGTGIATLQVNGGTALPPDDYRLTVMGSTSIKDLAGNPLDGDGDGTGGDDFVRNFSVDAACYTLTLDASPAAGGSLSADPAPDCNGGTGYSDGTVVGLTATPNEHYSFDGWSGDASGTDNPVSVTMDGDKSVTADFQPNCYTLAAEVSPAGAGTLDITPVPDCNGGAGYTPGTVVELTATPNEHYSFDGWSGDASGTDNPVSVTMDGDKSVTADFQPNCYTLAAEVSPAGAGTLDITPAPDCNGGAGYTPGTDVTLTAFENEGYRFRNWSGDASGSDPTAIVTMDGDRAVTAHYELLPIEDQMPIGDVEIDVSGDGPYTVEIHVEGHLPDTCTRLDRIEQSRDGTNVTVDVIVVRRGNVACAPKMKPFSQYVMLEGEFLPGDYTLTLNGEVHDFSVP